MRRGSPGPISGRLWRGPLQDLGARAATGGCVIGIDAEPGLHHQGAMRRTVLALIIWRQRRPVGRESPRPTPLQECCPLPRVLSRSTHTSATSILLGARERGLFTGALAAGLAVTGSFPGGPQMKRASGAKGLVGSQALDLPRLHATLAGARTLGRPQLPNQTFAVLQAPPAAQAPPPPPRTGLSWSIMTSLMERAHLILRCTESRTMLNCSWPCSGAQAGVW